MYINTPCLQSLWHASAVRHSKMQASLVVSLILLCFACLAAPNRLNPPTGSSPKNLSTRALQRQNSTPSTKAEISKAKLQPHTSTKGQQDPPKPRPMDPLHRQNSAPTTKSNVERAKKQVQSSSQDTKNALVADIVLGRQKDRAKSLAAKAEANLRRVKDWQSQINAHFVSSWKGFKQGNGEALNRQNQKIRWKIAMQGFNMQRAKHHENEALQAKAIAAKMEISGVRLRSEDV